MKEVLDTSKSCVEYEKNSAVFSCSTHVGPLTHFRLNKLTHILEESSVNFGYVKHYGLDIPLEKNG